MSLMRLVKFIRRSWKRQRLIMTLLVRDEADIVRYNIDYHLLHGVDFIIATDNGSKDGTRDILLDYQKRGVLHLVDEKEQDYNQVEWVNRMGRLAYEKYGADIIFHCDADEFWFSKSGNLKNEFLKKQETDILKVNLLNVLLEDKDKMEKFPNDSKWVVIIPRETQNFKEDSKNENLYFFKYPPKVIYRTKDNYLDVVQGNHSVVSKNNLNESYSNNIVIYHFPVRCQEHFFRKVVNGGRSYENNRKLGKETGWHWKRWYEAYKNGKLDEEYKKLTITREKADELLKTGTIAPFDFEKFINS